MHVEELKVRKVCLSLYNIDLQLLVVNIGNVNLS